VVITDCHIDSSYPVCGLLDVDQLLHGREVNGPFCVIELHCLRKMQWLSTRVWAHGQQVGWLVVLSLSWVLYWLAGLRIWLQVEKNSRSPQPLPSHRWFTAGCELKALRPPGRQSAWIP
jgi:hypothetical protein